MLRCYVLGPEDQNLGVLGNDFIFRPNRSCTIHKLSFYKYEDAYYHHLFCTEITPRSVGPSDEVKVTFDTCLQFHYLIAKINEPLIMVRARVMQLRALLTLAERIKHERKARDELNTWDPQIYKILFNEK